MLLERPGVDEDHPDPPAVSITRLVCQTIVVMTILVGSGLLLVARPEYSSVAIAFIGVVIGASFGLVRMDSLRRRRKRPDES